MIIWLLLTCLDHLCRTPAVQAARLETSQHVTGFYEQTGGFQTEEIIEDGYACGLHRIKMRREMSGEDCAAMARQLTAARKVISL
jgi:hypothetical protein